MAANNITTIACNNIQATTQEDMRESEPGWRKEMQFPCPHPSIDPAIHGGIRRFTFKNRHE
jgi:hypothetical protein